MQAIIAPAKKMQVDLETLPVLGQPQFLDATRELLTVLKGMAYPELRALWQCSEKLATTNYNWLQQLDLDRNQTPAVCAYTGIQYQSLAADLLPQPALDYLQDHLRILSGFYGVLRPFDGIVPYRLSMDSRLAVGDASSLYAFWGKRLYDALDFSAPVINLASKEYSKAIAPYLQPDDVFVEVVFGHMVDGRLKTRANQAKMARGQMARYMAEHNVQEVAALRDFDDPKYRYDPAQSTETRLVFVAQEK